jgi:hypothetical protein
VSASKTVSMAQLTEGFVGQIKAQLLQAQTDALREGEESMQAGFDVGREIAYNRITEAVTPTGKARAEAGEGEAGRVNTGFMRANFTSQVKSSGSDRVSGKLGWLDGSGNRRGKEQAGYIALQDNGFEIKFEGDGPLGDAKTVDVEGVHALLNANIKAQQVFESEFRKRIGALFT